MNIASTPLPLQFQGRPKKKADVPALAVSGDLGAIDSPHGLLNDVKTILRAKKITAREAEVSVGSTPLHASLQRPDNTHHRFIEVKTQPDAFQKVKDILSQAEGMRVLNPNAFLFVKGPLRAAIELTQDQVVLG